MTYSKKYTNRRKSPRTAISVIHLRPVVVLQPPPAPLAELPPKPLPPAPSPYRKVLEAVWRTVKVIGPALTAVVALLISLLSYRDEHSARVASARAAARAEASQVTFWLQAAINGNQPELVIQNRSGSPVPESIGQARVTEVDSTTPPVPEWLANLAIDTPSRILNLGTLPPCSVITTNALIFADSSVMAWILGRHGVTPADRRAAKKSLRITTELDTLTFTDSVGRYRPRDVNGRLRQIHQGTLMSTLGGYQPYKTITKPADGCP